MNWQDYYCFHQNRIPIDARQWLLDKESLTARLQRLYGAKNFSVKMLNESYTYANLDDADALGIQAGTRLRVREVHLLCKKKPLVYARSLIPLTSMVGHLGRLHFQGSKSLGAALFSDPTVKRGPIQIVESAVSKIPGAGKETVWGRRSIFHVSNRPLLVSEFYLPELLKR